MVKKNTGWTRATFDRLPHKELYIFDATLPGPLEDDKRFLGSYLETERRYTFNMAAIEPTLTAPGGTARAATSPPAAPPARTTSSGMPQIGQLPGWSLR